MQLVQPGPCLDPTAMPTRIHRFPWTVFFHCLVAIAPTCVQASSTTLTINATIIEVQCTEQQRARIRACATGQEKYTSEPMKMMIAPPSAKRPAQMPAAHYEIHMDPTRPVMIKTVLY